MTRRLAATLTILLGALAPPAIADEPLPDAADVVDAYLALVRWIPGLDLPDRDDEASRMTIANASAAFVQLRHRGTVLGRGMHTSDERPAMMVRLAMGDALGELLGHPTVSQLPDELRGGVGKELTIELEAAGALVPLPGRTFARIAEQIEPGLDGIAMRADERIVYRFPAQLRATNQSAHVERVLPAMALELDLPVRDFSELVAEFGVRVYRFRTVHLAQYRPGGRPFETYRGQVIVSKDAVTVEGLVDFADHVHDHLIMALWQGEESLGLMGDYHVESNRYQPIIGPPVEQALCAFALARFANCAQLEEGVAERVRTTVTTILKDLTMVEQDERSCFDEPAACAAVLYAITEMPDVEHDRDLDFLRNQCLRRLLMAIHPIDGFVPLPERRAPRSYTPHDQALMAGALARLVRTGAAEVDPTVARRAADLAWRSVPPAERLTLLPWIAWAEADFAAGTGLTRTGTPALVEQLKVLRAIRIDGDAAPLDLVGGYGLVTGGSPRATTQTARPASFLAWAIAEPDLVPPAESPLWLRDQLLTMRFLFQLGVDHTMLWSVPKPERALGGVRQSPWDATQPLAAQGMALLAAAETLHAIDRMGRRWAAEQGGK